MLENFSFTKYKVVAIQENIDQRTLDLIDDHVRYYVHRHLAIADKVHSTNTSFTKHHFTNASRFARVNPQMCVHFHSLHFCTDGVGTGTYFAYRCYATRTARSSTSLLRKLALYFRCRTPYETQASSRPTPQEQGSPCCTTQTCAVLRSNLRRGPKTREPIRSCKHGLGRPKAIRTNVCPATDPGSRGR